jgi:hypothetical protein
MKTLRASFAVLCLGIGVAQAQDPDVSGVAGPAGLPNVGPARNAPVLEQLVGPIALYPDALIALILPASTAPADIVLAARHVREFPNDRSQIEHRAWDESVKSLTNYPEVIRWMDENLQWTKQLGEAFAEQPADVMQAIQRLRAKARVAGTLVDTPQQQVIAEPQVIRIVPAQPDVIYVPRYEPEIVFVDRPVYYSQPFITFGIGVPVGSWLAFDCDWHRHSIWAGNRHRVWRGHDWHRPLVPLGPPAGGFTRNVEVRQWRPAPSAARPVQTVAYSRSSVSVVRPTPIGVATPHSYAPRAPIVSRAPSAAADFRRNETAALPVVNGMPQTFQTPAAGEVVGPRAAPPAPRHGRASTT